MVSVAEAKAVKKRHEAELLALPNVKNLGVGPGTGQETGEIVIKVFVSRKVPLEDLAPEDRVPSELEGVRTDVEVLSRLLARPEEREETRHGGSQEEEGHSGTDP